MSFGDGFPDPIPLDQVGRCDTCEIAYDVTSIYDHCTECGNCWVCCQLPGEHAYAILQRLDISTPVGEFLDSVMPSWVHP